MKRLTQDNTHNQLVDAIANYKMPEVAQELLQNDVPLLLCGITAAGKDTLAHELIGGGGYEAVISHTTRKPRENHGVLEVNGTNYFFVDDQTMLQMVADKQFIEAKPVHGKTYGTSILAYKAPLSRGNVPILDIDVQGAEEFVMAVPGLRPIFLLPPNFRVWQERLAGRGDIETATLKPRMISAIMEIETIMKNPAFQLLINIDKAQTAQIIRGGNIGRARDAVDVAEHLIYEVRNWLEQELGTRN